MALGLDIKAAVSPALIKRGSVNIIGLEAIRAQTGARWEKMQGAIRARLETMLSNKLGATDFFTRMGEDAYLVVTPSGDGDEARLCCLKIAYDLHRSLLGNCAIADLALSRVAGEANETLELEALTPSELAELAVRGGIEELLRDISPPAGLQRAAAANFAAPDGSASFRFAPIWDAPHEVVTSYRLHIQPAPPAELVAPARHGIRQELRTFLAGLAHTASMLEVGLRSGGRFLMIVPVSYDLLSAPGSRMEIASACRNLPAELRPFLAFSISNLPVGVPQSRLGELVCAIKPFGRAIMAHIALGATDLSAYQNIGLSALGFDLAVPATATDVRVEVARLGAAAKRLGLASFLTGVTSLALADCGRRAGIKYLCGPYIGREIEVPQAMMRLSWSDLVLRDRADAQRQTG